MIVYIESNFLLELALGQEEAPSAESILDLAEEGKLELVFPAFALSEPFSTVTYRGLERKRLYNSLAEQLVQLQRSTLHQQIASALEPVLPMWAEIEKKEADLLQSTAQRLLDVGKSIETNSSIFQQALVYGGIYDLSLQDSIVYSSVIADLHRQTPAEAKCFISRNWKDFGLPGIKSELGVYGCRYIASFVDDLGFIQSNIT